MTTPQPPPHKRHLGLLGVAIYTLLSPSGKFISSAAAATLLVGGLVTQLRPPSPPAAQAPAATPVVPARLAHSGSSALVLTYFEVDGQTIPIVLTDHPMGNRSVGLGPASASPSVDLSGGGGHGSGPGSSNFGPRHGSPIPPGTGSRGLPPKASQPDAFSPGKVAGGLPKVPGSQLPPKDVSTPGNGPGGLSKSPGSQIPPEDEAGAPMSPLQDEPRLLEPPFPGNVPDPVEATESGVPTGTDDSLNPLIPLSGQREPLLTAPYDGQSPPQIAEASPAAVPEPSVIGLMLLGLAALGWTGRRRLTPTRRA